MKQFTFKSFNERANAVIGKRFVLILIAEAIVIFAVGWFLLLSVEYQKIQNTGLANYATTLDQLAQRQDNLTQLQLMKQRYDELSKERLHQIEPVLPVGLEPVEVISQMQGFADAANVRILSIDVVTPEPVAGVSEEEAELTGVPQSGFENENIRTATITLNLESSTGSYAELKQFLDSLESFVPILELTTMNFVPETKSMALQLQTFYLTEDPK